MNIFEKIKLLPSHLNGFLMGDPNRNGEYKFLSKQIKTNQNKSKFILFDVGANIGEYTQYATSINQEIQVHCFEPVKKTFGELKKNINNDKVVFNNWALSDTIGTSKIFVYGELFGTNSINYHPSLASQNNPLEEVINLSTLDNYIKINNINNINFLKIDTEGHELNVLKGGVEAFNLAKIDVIQFEYNELWKNTKNKLQDVFELLEKNYDFYRLTPWGKLRVKKFSQKLENFPKASNYVAIKKINV